MSNRSLQMIGEDNLSEIPSEYIEPYLIRFMMMKLQALHYRLITPEKIRTQLNGVESFVSAFAGLHAQLATSNEYYKIMKMDDETMTKIADEIFNKKFGS